VFKDKEYEEHIIKGKELPEKGLGPARLIDLISIGAIRFRPSIFLIERNKELLDNLKGFEPEVILNGNFIFMDLLAGYKERIDHSVKIISLTDSYRVIYNSFSAIEHAGPSLTSHFSKLSKLFLKKRYFEYYLERYRKLLEVSDTVMVPTKKDTEDIRDKFKPYLNKVIVLPFVFISRRLGKEPDYKNARLSKSVNRILFLGAYNFWPNKEAMELIENQIAPLLPDKEFIIEGNGVPVRKIKNVSYIGTVSNLKSIIDDTDMCLAPLLHGTSIKTKILEYYLAGKLIVGTSEAFNGYPVKDNFDAIIEDDIGKYAMRIENLEKNKPLMLKMQKNARNVVKKLDFKKVEADFLNAINN
jgi:glycosyltransferase involved in cell wall biosynthesis